MAKLVAFLVGMLVVGMLVVPRLMRLIVAHGQRTETTVVASVGICFACALLARKFGYSVALGAFLGGALVAESGEGKTIEHAHGAGPRHVRGHLLRVGGHADRSRRWWPGTGWRCWC